MKITDTVKLLFGRTAKIVGSLFLVSVLVAPACFSQKDSSNFLQTNTFRILAGGFGSSSTYEKGFDVSFNYERVLSGHLTVNNLGSLVMYTGSNINSRYKEVSFNLNIASEIRFYFFLKKKQAQEGAYANMRGFYTGMNLYAMSNRIGRLYNDKENWHIGQAGLHVRSGWQKQFSRAFINLYGGAHVGLKKFKSNPTYIDQFEPVNYGFRVGYLF